MNVTCPYCGKFAELVDGKVIYPHRDDLFQLQFWRCKPCNAHVGCHRGTIVPLGRLANYKLRQAKQAAHQAFDVIWKGRASDKRHYARKKAYKWLSEAMGLTPEQTHIGMFDEEQCARVVELCHDRAAEAMVREFTIGD